MNKYIPLALGLALGEAKAEEPKECIEQIVVNINFPENNIYQPARFVNAFATQSERQEYFVHLSKPSEYLYTEILGIPVVFSSTNTSPANLSHSLTLDAIYKSPRPDGDTGTAFTNANKLNFTSKTSLTCYNQPMDEDCILQDAEHMGLVIAHEIGHFFGLENNNDHGAPGKVNIMAPFPDDITSRYFEYDFAEGDKAKIQSQMCPH